MIEGLGEGLVILMALGIGMTYEKIKQYKHIRKELRNDKKNKKMG